jgi:hypothetical protein
LFVPLPIPVIFQIDRTNSVAADPSASALKIGFGVIYFPAANCASFSFFDLHSDLTQDSKNDFAVKPLLRMICQRLSDKFELDPWSSTHFAYHVAGARYLGSMQLL